MPGEEIIISHDPEKVCHLRLKRRKHFVECLSRVLVNIDGVETAALSNGEEILLPVKPGSVIELDLQAPAWHNYYKLELAGAPEIEFAFSWTGSGDLFKHNNLRLLSHSGCRIIEENRELSAKQKLDNKMSFWFIGILLAAYVVLLFMKCCLGICF